MLPIFDLTHNISCIVPDGFSCIVPASVDVVGYNNLSVLITSNSSLPDGSYTGLVNVTRLIDGRVFSSVLSLGISAGFGQGVGGVGGNGGIGGTAINSTGAGNSISVSGSVTAGAGGSGLV